MVDNPANPPASLASVWRALTDRWCLARPVWRAPTRRRAWVLLASVVMLTLGTVWLNVQFSSWNNSFYITLHSHDLARIWRQLGVLAAVFVAVAVDRQRLKQLLFMGWRIWLAGYLLEGSLLLGTAYRQGLRTVSRIDNPNQRVAEDARGSVSATLELALGLSQRSRGGSAECETEQTPVRSI